MYTRLASPTSGSKPVPVRLTSTVPSFESFESIFRLADLAPAVDGLKATFTVRLAEGVSVP
jgi:hypothetical protein